MLPAEMSQLYWDTLLEVKVKSNEDDTIYTGMFYKDARRAL